MQTIFTRIKKELADQGVNPGTNAARTWLIQKAKDVTNVAKLRANLLNQRSRQRDDVMIGRMYFFFYHPKLRDELPYWDRFPLVIPINQYNDGFLGLNLHYISPKDRLILLGQLKGFAIGSKKNERLRLRLSYPILQATAQAYRSTPCIKRYLWDHVMSRLIEVPYSEWDIAAALPLQQFKGASTSQVWSDSKEMF